MSPLLKTVKRRKRYDLLSVKGLDFRQTKKERGSESLPLYQIAEEEESAEKTLFNRFINTLGQKKRSLAKRCVNLQFDHPNATLPELITLDWLLRENIRYYYQAEIYGGRSRQSGLVPDFVVVRSGKGMAWLVQGSYYHSQAFQDKWGQTGRDALAKMRLLGSYVNGVRIEIVIEIKEQDLYSDPEVTLSFAAAGIQR